jgi:type IV secretory pathway VirB4 component|tara:strand:- start:229 stop:477 length:249 start_codon:yes stop_codon:yes gene_type:complete
MSVDRLKEELQSILNLDDCIGYEDIINKLSEEISFLEKENKRLYRTIDNKMTHIQRLEEKNEKTDKELLALSRLNSFLTGKY